jgi:hypothetical protein
MNLNVYSNETIKINSLETIKSFLDGVVLIIQGGGQHHSEEELSFGFFNLLIEQEMIQLFDLAPKTVLEAAPGSASILHSISSIRNLLRIRNNEFLEFAKQLSQASSIQNSKIAFERGYYAVSLYPDKGMRYMKDMDIKYADHSALNLISMFLKSKGFKIALDNGNGNIMFQGNLPLKDSLSSNFLWIKQFFPEAFSVENSHLSLSLYFDLEISQDNRVFNPKHERDGYKELALLANSEIKNGIIKLKHLLDGILASQWLKSTDQNDFMMFKTEIKELLQVFLELGFTDNRNFSFQKDKVFNGKYANCLLEYYNNLPKYNQLIFDKFKAKEQI